MVTRVFAATCAALLIAAAAVFAQAPGGGAAGDAAEEGEAEAAEERDDRLALAVSNPNYPVTPGDTYELTFTTAGQLSTSVVTVGSDGTLSLNIFGEIDTTGMTYTSLKRDVEATVRNAYPRSLPSFRLVSVGLFEVTIRGAIEVTTRVTAWGLSRLSDVIGPYLRPYSSTRRVVVSYDDGERIDFFDVFRALNVGAGDQDPYIRPGQSVRVLPVGSLVTVRGEVNEPGQYEILPGETLADVIEYAGGFSPTAEPKSVRLERSVAGRTSSETHDLEPEEAEGPMLEDSDQITVDSSLRGRPFVFIEGALSPDEEPEPDRQTIEVVEEDIQDVEASYVRIAELYHRGLMLSDMIASLRDRLTTFADLGRTTVIRAGDGDIIMVDASELLYGYGEAEDVRLEPFDTVFIPSRRISVLVTGPVAEPGLYLYVPGQRPEYYIRRAGGYNREVSSTGDYSIYDSLGNPRAEASRVQPGDRIEVERNNFVYQFNRHFPVVISSLTLVTTVISVLTLISQ